MAHGEQYRDLVSPSLNESHKMHIFSLTKLAKTASEFCGKMASLKESSAHQMLTLVETYRKKTLEIRKRPEHKSLSFYSVWDQVLDEIEQDAKAIIQLAGELQTKVAAALFHEASRKKGLFKKMFTYRDYFQNLIQKSEEDLNKMHKDYTDAWMKYRLVDKDSPKDHRSALYYNSHNAYLLQLAEVNGRTEFTYHKTIPEILDDLETLQGELAGSFAKHIARFAELQLDYQSGTSSERLQNVVNSAGQIDARHDIGIFVQSIDENTKTFQVQRKEFTAPRLTKEHKETKEIQVKDQSKLKEGLILNDFTEPVLKRRCAFTRRKITKLESTGAIDDKDMKRRRPSSAIPQSATSSMRKQSSAVMSKNDMREKNCHLSCLNAQMAVYSPAILEKLGPVSEEYADDLEELGDEEDFEGKKLRLLSMRPDKEKAHKFLEYNFLKPAQCYYCKGIIVGIIKQGCRCQSCKMSVHKRCRGNVPFCTGTPMTKLPSFEREFVEQDSSAGEYEAIEAESEQPSPPIPVSKGPVLESKAKRSASEDSYAPPVPPRSTSAGQSETRTDNPQECVALYDFAGQESGDLEIKAGDRIKILSTPSADWWEGETGSGKGYFPTSYVQVIQPSDTILRCLYDFESEEGDEMCIDEGQIIVLVTDENNGWMIGTSGDKQGAFPSGYVEMLS